MKQTVRQTDIGVDSETDRQAGRESKGESERVEGEKEVRKRYRDR